MTAANAIPKNPDVLRANSLIGQFRTSNTSTEWWALYQALADAERDAIVWDDLKAAVRVRAEEAAARERRISERLANDELKAPLVWMLGLVTQHAGTKQEGFAREVVQAVTSEHRISDDAREWLRRLMVRGDELHREWAVRLMGATEE